MAFLEISKLTAEQLPAAVELDRLCFGGLWTLQGYQRELDSPNSDLLGLWKFEHGERGEKSLVNFSALESGSILVGLGCLWAILEEAHITIVAIHPEYQRWGLGQALLFALLKSAWQRGLERTTLEVRPSNLAAVSLYQKFGFQEAGRRRGYYEDNNEDALILWLGGLNRPQFVKDLVKWEQQISDRLSEKNLKLIIGNDC